MTESRRALIKEEWCIFNIQTRPVTSSGDKPCFTHCILHSLAHHLPPPPSHLFLVQCFMNSILQCLSHTPGMAGLFLNERGLKYCGKSMLRGELAKGTGYCMCVGGVGVEWTCSYVCLCTCMFARVSKIRTYICNVMAAQLLLQCVCGVCWCTWMCGWVVPCAYVHRYSPLPLQRMLG